MDVFSENADNATSNHLIGVFSFVINHINEGKQFNCINCNLHFTETDKLTKHFKPIHLGRKYPRGLCSYMRLSDLTELRQKLPARLAGLPGDG